MAIRDLSRVAFLSSVGASAFNADDEGRNELEQKRARRWKVRTSRWWRNSESLGEVKLMIGIENWCRLDVTSSVIADRQRRDIIELCQVSI